MSISWTYSLSIRVPWTCEWKIPFQHQYTIEPNLSCCIECKEQKSGIMFNLDASVETKAPLEHDPDDYQHYVPRLAEYYRMVRLAIILVIEDKLPEFSKGVHDYKLPILDPPLTATHDLYEQAERQGTAVDRFLTVRMNMPIEWRGTRPVFPADEIHECAAILMADAQGLKYKAAVDYIMGLLALANPYPYWFRALEHMQDARYITSPKNKMTIEGRTIDIEVLRMLAQPFRHSENNVHSKQVRARPDIANCLTDEAEIYRRYRLELRLLLMDFLKCGICN